MVKLFPLAGREPEFRIAVCFFISEICRGKNLQFYSWMVTDTNGNVGNTGVVPNHRAVSHAWMQYIFQNFNSGWVFVLGQNVDWIQKYTLT